MSYRFLFVALLLTPALAQAHDTWIQTNTNLVRVGDNVHIDLMLGNHGNDHRDYKLASKMSREACKLEVIAPGGQKYDLAGKLVDAGYTPSEGFWTARFTAADAGLYTLVHQRQNIHGTTRGIKSGKAFYLVSKSLDNVPVGSTGFDKPLGHALEIVPVANPVAPMGPGQPIKVQVLYHGKPLAKARVSFIPRSQQLSEEFDETFERTTAADGLASFTPKEGDYVLVCVHHLEPTESGEGYSATKYSATLTVFVPQVCPCCGE